MSEYFQVSIPVPPAVGEFGTHNFKRLIVQTIADQNSGFKSMAEVLLDSIEVVGISLDDLHPKAFDSSNEYLNVTLELRGPENIMNAWAELNAVIF